MGECPETEANFFKWVVGGALTVVAALAGVLWFMLIGQLTDLKLTVQRVSDSVFEIRGDIKLLTAKSGDQSDQIAEMRGFLKKKSPSP